jgi:glycosyltransferase involved in cell wall biosynthesis
MPGLSVILCTHNPREGYLRRVLEGLRAQVFPLPDWELLLIDNGSDSPLTPRFDLSWHPNGRHVREDELGLTPARSRGIRESRGDILVFVDDDTVPASNYLEQTLAIAEAWPFAGAWSGSVVPEYEKPLPEWVGNQVWRLNVISVKEDIWSNLRDPNVVPAGAGLSCRRKVAEFYLEWLRQKPKSLSLGRKGGNLSGYEDIDISYCAVDLGMGTGRSTRLSMTHLIPTSRLTLEYFLRHAEGDAASLMLFRAIRGFPVEKPKPITWLGSLRWFVHRVKERVPREQYEIQKAHQRGLERGWQLAQEYLKVSAKR